MELIGRVKCNLQLQVVARNHTLHKYYDTFTISNFWQNNFKGCKYSCR